MPPKITFRPTAEDQRFLTAIALSLQAAWKTPFVNTTDAIRAALRAGAASVLRPSTE